MNTPKVSCIASPYNPKPYAGFRKAENGYIVNVYDKDYVFGSFNEAVEFLREVFSDNN